MYVNANLKNYDFLLFLVQIAIQRSIFSLPAKEEYVHHVQNHYATSE